MNHAEIDKMCTRLSYRYNRPSHREDLAQEGMLKCYEILSEEPDAHPAKLYRAAKDRMHEYINVDILAVKVPTHNQTRALIWDLSLEKQGTMSEEGNSRLKQALSGSNTAYEEGDIASDLDQAQDYEEKDYASYMYATALEKLTRKEFHIIKLGYYEDMSQEEVGEALSMTHQYVSLVEITALSKLKTSFL